MSEFKLPWQSDDVAETVKQKPELKSGTLYTASDLLLAKPKRLELPKLWDTEPLLNLEVGMSVTWETMTLPTAKTIASRLSKRLKPKRWRAVKHESGSVEIGRVE